VTEASRIPLKIAYKVGLAVLLTLTLVNVLGGLFAYYAPWQKYMDPRKRILWDGHYDGSKVVMIGDSEFCSFYVDSSDKTIWSRTQSKINEKVFPGALDGCKSADLLNQGRIISSLWPKNTTVFIDIIPSRFISSLLPEPVEGNYEYVFRRHMVLSNSNDNKIKYLKNKIINYIGETSFFLYNETALKTFVDGLQHQTIYYKEGLHFNRIWYNEKDGLAYDRFRKFENNIVQSKGFGSFDWVTKLDSEFRSKGIRAVFVLTPLNKDLIRKYAQPGSGDAMIRYFNQAHNEIFKYTSKNKLSTIDLYNAADKDSFADMLHTNEQGDEIIANALALWITENRGVDTANIK
jgi:hypothetical protein